MEQPDGHGGMGCARPGEVREREERLVEVWQYGSCPCESAVEASEQGYLEGVSQRPGKAWWEGVAEGFLAEVDEKGTE